MSKCALAIALLIIQLAAAVVLAETSIETFTLEELKFEALKKSPFASELNLATAKASAEAKKFAKLTNPEVEVAVAIPYDYENERGDNEVEVSISQKLRAGDFGVRRKAEALQINIANSESQIEILKFLSEITLSYVRLWALSEEEKHLDLLAKRAEKIEFIVVALEEQGRVDNKDKELVLAKIAKISADQIGVRAAKASASNNLTRKSGVKVSGYQLGFPGLVQLPSLSEIKKRANRAEHGVVKRTALLSDLASKQLKLAEVEAFPAFTPKLFYSHNDSGADFVGLGISLELPFYDRNQSEKQIASESSKHSLILKEYVEGGGFDEELTAAYQRGILKDSQIKIYDSKIVPHHQRALEIGTSQFEAGQLSVLDLWQLEREYHAAFDEGLQLQIELIVARSELEILVGEIL